jgi:hypothetical protein
VFSQKAGACFAERGLLPRQAVVAEQEAVHCSLASTGVGLTVMIEEEAMEAHRSKILGSRSFRIGSEKNHLV